MSTAGSVLREILAGPTLDAARALLGAYLVRETPRGARGDEPRVGRIVEVEAYVGEDDGASHARFGRTNRNAVMFGPPGIAYVYLVYGMHECLNVVTEPEGRAAAVLIRAAEPIAGEASMRASRLAHAVRRARNPESRARAEVRLAALATLRLAAGPGLVAAAFGISRAETGTDLLDPRSGLRIEPGAPPSRIVEGPRVGISYAAEPWRSRPWRFLDPESPSLSAT
ncbi:MAG TPA: DNA-3-methyladenine glycosylase [Candidatus Limnocylindria bacterium]|nr:DNA-3-methyladenine glycosylase [Candidatus Limnocylindria bacterium]